ncbi:MAG: anaerobic ribonucleoside-triphosphate reductase activating protein [Clostridia bacterium]|nr:anaerobic ribonucleoside-triphosphate reductase activating protein [Clostridia bacterium]
MIFNGFQKMTLLDFPGRVACTLFAGGCNFRCPFCHNAGLVLGGVTESYSEDEILDYLSKRKGLLDGVCITGGEPLLRPDLKEFIIKVRALGYAVKLDTNGSLPERLYELIKEGLIDYVAMDVKSSLAGYGRAVGIENFDTADIEKSIDLLLEDRVDYEFRTTVAHPLHSAEDIEALCQRIKGAKRYFIQNFVDSGNLIGEGLSAPDPEIMQQMLEIAKKYIPDTSLRGI